MASTPAPPAARMAFRVMPTVDSLFYLAASIIVIGSIVAFVVR